MYALKIKVKAVAAQASLKILKIFKRSVLAGISAAYFSRSLKYNF
jgi:hypothetical protein